MTLLSSIEQEIKTLEELRDKIRQTRDELESIHERARNGEIIDVEKEVENDLISTYKNKLKSDILKVSHHGSNTSTSKSFLDYVEARYYIICVGRNNFYGFPNNHNLKYFDNVLRTDLDGTIRLRF